MLAPICLVSLAWGLLPMVMTQETDVQTPPRFDIEDIYHNLSPAGNIKLASSTPCYPTTAYAFVAALEIANFITTGMSVQFSIQEIVDCHFGHCKDRKFEDYAKWLAVIDRLAPIDKYSDYKSMAYTCRASTSPDALTHIKVTGYTKITVDQFEAAITKHGSVYACIDNSDTNCWGYERYREGILDGESSETCIEGVLIVGYTETYYRVRASKGPDYGENGYFRILRGGNKCGIESHMAVLETERRRRKNGIELSTGCPLEYPKYCENTRTCRGNNQFCTRADKKSGGRGRRSTGSRVRNPISFGLKDQCSDHPGYPCRNLARHCANPAIWQRCGATCHTCNPDGTPKCTDTEDFDGECASYVKYCRQVPALRIKCQVTCGVAPSQCTEDKRGTPGIVKMDPPPTGQCYPPTIPNGRLINRRSMLRHKERLMVRCNEGYTLVGENTYCDIQNAFRPDSRRLPQCIMLGGEEFEGRGAGYSGRTSTTTTGRTCSNWLKSAHRGLFKNIEQGKLMLRGGNHNYCRNIGDEFLPFCFTMSGQLLEYCQPLPNCGGDELDQCSTTRQDKYNCWYDFSPDACIFSDELSRNQKKWFWNNCGGMCCTYAGCQPYQGP